MATTQKHAVREIEMHSLDAREEVLGRLATRIAGLLLGKHRPDFAPHIVAPVRVVVTHAADLKVTGDKLTQKMYYRHTGYPGGLKQRSLADQIQRDPIKVIQSAVSGMLPKNNLRDPRLKNLSVFHGAAPEQSNTPISINKK